MSQVENYFTFTRKNISCLCFSGYQYDNRLSICIQSAGGCSNSPCSFGCHSLSSRSYSCDCPPGYKSVGDGHCVSTVNPSGFNSLHGDYDYDIEEDEEEFISTEGCFSCQMNGFSTRTSKRRSNTSRRGRKRHRRARNKRSSDSLSSKEHFLEAVGVSDLVTQRSLGNNVTVHLVVTKDQTRHRQTLVKFQPSRDDLSHSIDYTIVSDTSSGLLNIRRKAGVWALFFKKRISQPQKFNANVVGQLRKGPTSPHDIDLHAVFKIEVI